MVSGPFDYGPATCHVGADKRRVNNSIAAHSRTTRSGADNPSAASLGAEDAYLISDGSIREDFKQYNEGRKLVLRYQTPRRPYGLSEYPNPPGIESDDKALSKEEIELTRTALVYHDRYISDHTPGPVEAKVDLTVVDNISGGVGAGTQILLCKVEDTQYDGDTEICNNGKMQSDSSIRHFFNDTARRVKQACDAILSPWRQDAENAGDAGPSEDQKQEKSVLSERPTLIGDRLVLGQLVVVKVYDAMFYPGGMHQGLWKATSIADQEHSREAGTYSHLWTENKTGKLQITPQFYGSWAIELTTVNQQVSQKKRFARSIMIEHVKGRPEMADGTEFIFDEDFRLGVLQRLIDGYVNLLHVGVWLRIDPEDVLLTGKDGDVLLDKPRVVLIDYVNARIDSQFKKPNNIYQPWKMPPHPFGEFSMEKMIHFSGWYNHLWTTHHFDRWMKQVFGQLDDPRYTSPMVSKAFIDEIGTEDTGLPA
ncbi:hypothetical protein CkaCkLH20_01431 [Colletotrichum karsti]|uniref:Uncharacterized protein n=1 Tax=Colletotrichum karsti TaxID=1095194 RepID=A0A9P6LQ68_9PEZI|nr:uncharacterized protein CkaCkLH20_01431 [Colletotrichum karsti]KAF9881281.1 hypothetical protein CkaCkLH20_01431 [Colletotrichum karsti]